MSSVAELLARVRAIQDQAAALRALDETPGRGAGRDTALSAHIAQPPAVLDAPSPTPSPDLLQTLVQAYVHGSGGPELAVMFTAWAEGCDLQVARRGGFLIAINAEGKTVAVLDAQLAPIAAMETLTFDATLDASAGPAIQAPDRHRATSAKGGERSARSSRPGRPSAALLPEHPGQLTWPTPAVEVTEARGDRLDHAGPQPTVDRWRCVTCGAVDQGTATTLSLDLDDRWRKGTCSRNKTHSIMERY